MQLGKMVQSMMSDEGQKEGWIMTLSNQPASSHDLNVLNLGFFQLNSKFTSPEKHY